MAVDSTTASHTLSSLMSTGPLSASVRASISVSLEQYRIAVTSDEVEIVDDNRDRVYLADIESLSSPKLEKETSASDETEQVALRRWRCLFPGELPSEFVRQGLPVHTAVYACIVPRCRRNAPLVLFWSCTATWRHR